MTEKGKPKPKTHMLKQLLDSLFAVPILFLADPHCFIFFVILVSECFYLPAISSLKRGRLFGAGTASLLSVCTVHSTGETVSYFGGLEPMWHFPIPSVLWTLKKKIQGRVL